MGNNPTGATSTKIFHLRVDEEGWENLWLVDDPKHVLFERDRNALPVDTRIVNEIVAAARLSKDAVGILSAIVVRRGANGILEIVEGRQRYKAAVRAKEMHPELTITVPIRMMTLKDSTALKASVIGNEHRVADTIVSRAEKVRMAQECGFPQEQICEMYNVDWNTILGWLRILDADDSVRDAVTQGRITQTAAVSIARKPLDKQSSLVEKAASVGKRKPGRRAGDTTRRITIKAELSDDGGLQVKVPSSVSEEELGLIVERLSSLQSDLAQTQ